ncbi:DNA repair protein RecN [Candidatus Neptunochlamydia vexilliferae]|uniref:DNA repair protein RecN n=1 Tax=Candidatus Neptunichlamydia vexilliferae TaxID=1651774 RepID=A0ABS0B320_9BACT|nr:DNA repair protein RecN [Candidatus Neptunochlamydia vexilliferae]MBF5060141.1 DNA repair protein RecN [Candidatus Neptunochlamydia vexilliferae]
MIKTLTLDSFVLIDQATLTFDGGFHVLTGETGAGKTLLIQAIHLLTGQKVSSDLIRAGKEKAVIEATFEIEKLPALHTVLEEAGVVFDKEEDLIIKREVFRSAKNQIFINAQRVPLALLATLGPHLLELVGQNSAHTLRQSETQRKLLDLYGDLEEEVAHFFTSYQEAKELEELLKERRDPVELERLKWELEEWETFGYVAGEEETLFEEYKKLADSEQETKGLNAIQEGLEHPSLLPTLTQFQKLSKNSELIDLLKSAVCQLQEASFLTSKLLDDADYSPARYEELEERLTTLNRLKKKYQPEDIPTYLEALREKIDRLEHQDERLAAAKEKLFVKQEENRLLAKALTKKRQQASKTLKEKLTAELLSLNFPHAKVVIELSSKELGPTGGDQVTFSLAANQGEAPASLSNQTSGGEVARFLFALKILLAEKGALPTLVFDEIDANIGGETASLVGQKLQMLGKQTQVLVITHFPQVARYANHHLQIAKKEKEGRTLTEIRNLEKSEREGELLRMVGGIALQNLAP